MSSIRSRNFRSDARHWSGAAAAFLMAGLVWTGPLWAGTLEIWIKDHREAIEDFSKLEITIERIRIQEKSALPLLRGTWKELRPSMDLVDLTRYVDGRSARVFRGEVAPGKFEAIELKVKKVSGVLKRNKSIVEPKNALRAIRLGFSIMKDGETRIVLDLEVLDLSDHPPLTYELHIKGYEIYTDDRLIDKVPPG